MNKREAFIDMVEDLLHPLDIQELSRDDRNRMAFEFFEEFKQDKTKSKNIITENGLKILTFLFKNKDKYNNIFTTKNIGNELGISGHSVSGSMRKLIADEFVEKIGQKPTTYSITDKGINYINNN